MSRMLVIESTGFGLRGAVLDGDRLIELLDVDSHGDAVTDTLFAGRVEKVDRPLAAAFVEIGATERAFLAAKDARAVAGVEERLPVDRLLHEGQKLVVQGVREPVEGKGSRVTSDIKLFGFGLILRPMGRGVEVPARLPERQREALARRGQALFGEAGVTLRRAAAALDDEALRREHVALSQRWAQVEREAGGTRRPGRLTADEPPLERLLRRAVEMSPERILVADRTLALAAERLVAERLAGADVTVERLAGQGTAFEQTAVAAELDLALGRDVPLAGGGRLRIEETAACVAIDVDGGNRAALDADLAAAAEVARQVRLRNLGGTIVVDFIDLPTRPQRQRLEEALKRAFRDDPQAVQLYPMSPLGLVQLSRPRRGRTLAALMARPCAACLGSGRQPSLRAVAEQILARMRQGSPVSRLAVAPDVARYLGTEAASAWAGLGPVPAVEVDGSLPAGSWDAR
ncbi:MAG TPA: ribonuclease E/G [Geminicoccaceae bacterium]|nr:ribonuclease E/G [Geminicoccus sp.]HMU49295.1 ribonuclease E/G [Geminicoccaceae bacterium]